MIIFYNKKLGGSHIYTTHVKSFNECNLVNFRAKRPNFTSIRENFLKRLDRAIGNSS